MLGLFSPLEIKNIKLKNRIVMPPLASGKSTHKGYVTDDTIKHYEDRAKSGLALIVVEHSYITALGKASDNQLGSYDDSCIDGLKRLTDAIHKHDVVCALQINHAGSLGDPTIIGGTPVGPSAIIHPNGKNVPQELSDLDIKDIIVKFTEAAVRVKKAGFDMVEIHAAHGYLLSQFLSPLTNKRLDNYGGSLENRMRLHLEIVESIQSACGSDFTIAIRLGCDDLMPDGIMVNEAVVVAVKLQAAGVSLIDVSGGIGGSGRTLFTEEGYFSYITGELKKHLNVPVILTGGIKNPKTADKLIADSKADLIGIGRELLANANWASDARKIII